MSIDAVQEASSLIYESADDEANIILGAVINPDMEDEVRVTVIATGLEDRVVKAELPQVKKWTPDKKPISLKGSDRILSKNIYMPQKEQKTFEQSVPKEPVKEPENTAKPAQDKEPEQNLLEAFSREQAEGKPVLNESILPQEDIYDIPTFLRKKTGE